MIELVFLGEGRNVVYYRCDSLEKGIDYAVAERHLTPLGFKLVGHKDEPKQWNDFRQLVLDLRRHFPKRHPVSFPARNFFLDGYDYHLSEIAGEYGLISLQKVS
jgi:hypothetical protein